MRHSKERIDERTKTGAASSGRFRLVKGRAGGGTGRAGTTGRAICWPGSNNTYIHAGERHSRSVVAG